MARYKLRFIFLLVLPVVLDVWHTGEKTTAYTIFGRGKLKEKHMEDIGIDGRLY